MVAGMLGWKLYIMRTRHVSWQYLVSGLPGIIWVVSTPMEVLPCGAEAQRTGPRPESLITEYSDFPTPDLTYDLRRTGILALPSLLLVSAPAGSHLPWHL